MDRDRWRLAEPLFRQAMDLPAGEAAAFLEQACGDDEELRSEVEALLAADRDAGDLLERPAGGSAAALLSDGPEPAKDLNAGRQLGPYRLVRRIGAGGMGEVFLARDTRLHRSVAVKLLPPDRSADAARHERFILEAQAASALDHPNICTFHDVGTTDDGRFYLVMAYYRGETLERKLARGPLAVEQAVELAVQVGRGLARAHEAGIVHRDVKPANVMVTDRGEVKLLDFGIAKIAGAVGLTRTGALLGTPSYLSPEQARGEPVDARTDVWALGALLYEMLAGRRPFAGERSEAVIHNILTQDPAPLRTLRAEVPQALERIAFRALAKSPGERYPTMGELLRDLAPGPPSSAASRESLPATAETILENRGAEPTVPILRVLVATALVDRRRLSESLGEGRAFAFSARHDRAARDLLARFGGVEADKQEEGFLLLFERVADAVAYALAYHQALMRLAQEEGVELGSRAALHLGEVRLRRNPPADVARGAKPLEVEGLARPLVARLLELARDRQTLLTHAAFELARRGTGDGSLADPALRWLAHGPYVFDGVPEPLAVFEVGVGGFAPLTEPASSDHARRQLAIGDELTLGWRPAPGQPIPRRPNWRLEERLGEGGFGEVWLARHKSGDTRVFKFCFEAARLRALKREVTLFRLLKEGLGHRHDVARILDWNFDHAPYFLEAEHTEGGSLVDWAAAAGGLAEIPLPVRLELVAEVAEALAAAHSVGILHKDVKPENVLVAIDRDGRPRAQLTDFGIGLLTEEGKLGLEGITVLGFTGTSSPTESSGSGTVRYMAPELLEGKPASIQADVYSLGVVLYQMVAGDFSRALAPGWQRDVEDELLAEDLADLVDGRPERRPASATEVAERLRSLEARRAAREAEGRAREAAEAARLALERAQRRRKVATVVAAAALVVLAVVGVLAYRERQARRTADLRQRQAEDLIEFMLVDLRQKLQPVGRLEILEGVGAKAMDYFAAVPEGELSDAELARRSQALYQIGDVRVQQGRMAEAIPPFEESLRLAKALADRDPDDPQRLFDLAQSHFWLGSAHRKQGDLDAARAQFMSYFDLALRLVQQEPAKREWNMELAYAYTNLGAVQEAQGDLAAATQSVQRSVDIKRRLVVGGPESSDLQASLANGLSWLARVLEKQGDLRGALAAYRQERVLRARLASDQPDDAAARYLLAGNASHLADVRLALGQPRAALTHLAEMRSLLQDLTSLDPDNQEWRRNLAVCNRQAGQAHLALREPKAAEVALKTAQALFAELPAEGLASFDWQRDLGWIEVDLAAAALARGDNAAASARAERSLARLAPLLTKKPDDRLTLSLLGHAHLLVGRIRQTLGDEQGAQTAWERAYRAVEPTARTSGDPVLLDPWARAARHLGRLEEAGEVARRLRAAGYSRPEFNNAFEPKGAADGARKSP